MTFVGGDVTQLERDNRVAEALLRVAEHIAQPQEWPELLRTICRSAVELVGCDRCAIYLWNARRAAFIPVADHGTPAHLVPRFAERYYDRGTIAFEHAVGAGNVMVVTRDEPRTAEAARALEETELYALAVVPLPARGETVGWLTLGRHTAPGFDEEALAVSRAVARQAAPVIDSARLFTKLKKAAAFRAGLAQLAVDVTNEDDPIAIARLVSERGATLFRVDGGAVFGREGDRLILLAANGSLVGRGEPLAISLGDERLPSVRALRSGQPLFINDVRPGAFSDRALVNVLGLKAVLNIPLTTRGEPIGCVVFGDSEQRFPFSKAIAEEGALLGNVAVAAIERWHYAKVDRARRRAEHQADELTQRTVELTAARNAAVSAAQAKAEFLANMSHEIRTPMTAILGYVNILANPETTETERAGHLDTIRRNGQHLLRIINDILDLSKIEAGRMIVESVECWPTEIVEQIASLMSPRAREKGLTFGVEYTSPIPERIRADPTRLRQILLNLVGNAIKFTEAGGVTVRVAFEGQKSQLHFEVVDTGVGVSPEAQARLFTPFTQGDPSMSRRFGGTGLGLAISKRLAEMLGGDITVRSALERGSTFALTLPTGALEGVPLLRDPARPDAPPPPRSPARDLRLRARILVVEDAPDNQRLFGHYLRRAGAEVAIADDGARGCEAALAAAAAGAPFDAILMDMQMPDVDGYEATRRLRDAGYRGPVIALTAHAMETDREKCLKAGCDDFISKPVEPDHLIETIQAQVGRIRPPLADEGEMGALVEIFVAGLHEQVAAMEASLAAGALDRLAVAAYQLKGTAGDYGFPSLGEAAANLESSVRARLGAEEIRKRLRQVVELSLRAASVEPAA